MEVGVFVGSKAGSGRKDVKGEAWMVLVAGSKYEVEKEGRG